MQNLDEVLNRIYTFFIISYPQFVIYVYFAAVLLGIWQPILRRRLMLLGIFALIYVDVLFAVLPTSLHIVNSMATSLTVIWFVFRRQSAKMKLLILTLLNFMGILFDTGFLIIYTKLGGDYSKMWDTAPLLMYLVYWVLFSVLLYAGRRLQRRETSPFKRFIAFLMSLRGRPAFYLTLLSVMQVVCISYFILKYYVDPVFDSGFEVALYVSLILIVLVLALAIREIIKTREEAIRSTQKTYISELNQMFATVRGQRHDFINHVQVMHSLLAMNKMDRLREYMHGVAEEIRNVDRAHVDHPSPALAALVEAKIAIADAKRISFDYRIDDAPATFGSVTSIDLVRMIGNLIDNAFDAVLSIPVGERYVLLDMTTIRGALIISVTNHGTILTEEQMNAMLTPGYTTKAGEHSGLGLSNVVERAAAYRGTVAVESDESRGVVITIRIPNVAKAKLKNRKDARAADKRKHMTDS
ncbi:sensor histidine kinase [Paenibacillus methanolicus]|uniref:GHKL domain-containing protein n=1 Tax=Paenibacillus methanolicus TaxID=582686 RepID=A0A5S5BVX3_9BACL|nr:Spo0B domain-containing protein [Paenibacillus methanolicus]TYP71177.1 GHKL domain-containing protein [Paenibacillus methanolicus]